MCDDPACSFCPTSYSRADHGSAVCRSSQVFFDSSTKAGYSCRIGQRHAVTQRVRVSIAFIPLNYLLRDSPFDPLCHFCRCFDSYIGKKHLETAMRQVLSKPLNPGTDSLPLAFAVVRVPFFLEPEYDESKPFVESNRDRLVKKWGGKEGWERQKHHHECVRDVFSHF